jgi:uncharacterized OB-fold protein
VSELPTNPPVPTPETMAFWEATQRDVLLLPKCDACGELHWYPRGFCPFCHKGNIFWIEASGEATLYTYSVSMRGRDRWAEVTPYVVAYVELAEGLRILTNVVDCDPESLEVGQKLSVVFDEAGDYKFPRFRPA